MRLSQEQLTRIYGETHTRQDMPIRIRAKGDESAIDPEKRTIKVAFSSEYAVERWWGWEILGHKKGEIDFSRLNDGAAVLLNHDINRHPGVVDSASLDSDRVGRATLRFGQSTLAQEAFQDVEDEILRHTSVGYSIEEVVLERSDETGDYYRAVRWTPHEISLVSVPADPTVGLGRSLGPDGFTPEQVRIKPPVEKGTMTEEEKRALEAKAKEDAKRELAEEAKREAEAKAARDKEVNDAKEAGRAEARESEQARVKSILALGNQSGQHDEAQRHIDDGKSVEDFANWLGTNGSNKATAGRVAIGMTDSEAQQFRFTKLLLAAYFPNERHYQEEAAFELEAISAAREAQREATGNDARGMVIPAEVAEADMAPMLRAAIRSNLIRGKWAERVLLAGTANQGQELVATDLLAANFIDVLRNTTVLMAMGAVLLDDLRGNVAIPRKTSGSAGAWIAENGDAPESEAQFDQVPLAPKTVAGYMDWSRMLLLQSSLAVEALVRLDQARGIALAIDLAGLVGSGASNQPTGVFNQTGINTSTVAAAASPTYGELVDFETAVATDNADMGSLGYIVAPATRGYAKQTEKFSSTGQTIWEPGNLINGYPTGVTNQISNVQYMFGNWADVMIGMWGDLDVLIDPYTGSRAMRVRSVVHQTVDVAIRHPESFCKVT